MKSKKIFAAILCAVTLLTGCSGASESSGGTNSNQSSSISVQSYSEDNSSSTESSSFTSSSTMSSSSSKPISTSSKADKKVYSRIYPEIIGGTNNDGKWIFNFQLSDKGGTDFFDGNFVDKTGCTVFVYASDSPDSIGEVVQEMAISENAFKIYEFYIHITPWETTKYVRIKVVGKDFTSEYSNYYEIPPKYVSTPEISRYTHTFTAPSYLTVIPNYSEALAEIERGVEPQNFSISVQFTCPGCGKSNIIDVWMVKFAYSRDDEMPFKVNCLMGNCPYHELQNTLRTTIKSHAVRIS